MNDIEENKNWNPDVPIETLYRWKSRECMKLKKRVTELEETVKHLRDNIKMILDDPEAKQQIRCDARVRMVIKEKNALEKKLHEARNDREALITKLALATNDKKEM